MTHNALGQLLDKHGFPRSMAPSKKRVRTAVHQTLNDMQCQGLLERISETPEFAVWQWSDRHVKDETSMDAHASYAKLVSFCYDKKTGSLTASDPAQQYDIDARMAVFMDSYMTAEIRAVVTAILFSSEINGSPLRADGGFYFVPDTNRAALARLGQFISELGQGCHMGTLIIPDTPDGAARQEVSKSYMDHFWNQIDVANKDLTKLEDTDAYRLTTLDKKRDELIEMQQNAQMYLKMLHIDKTAAETAINDLENRILDLTRQAMNRKKGS